MPSRAARFNMRGVYSLFVYRWAIPTSINCMCRVQELTTIYAEIVWTTGVYTVLTVPYRCIWHSLVDVLQSQFTKPRNAAAPLVSLNSEEHFNRQFHATDAIDRTSVIPTLIFPRSLAESLNEANLDYCFAETWVIQSTTNFAMFLSLPCGSFGPCLVFLSGAAGAGTTKAYSRSDYDGGGSAALEQYWYVQNASRRPPSVRE